MAGLVLGLVAALALPARAQAQDAPPVETARAEARPVVERLRLTGTVVAPRTALVSSDIEALVARVHVDLGDRVARDAPLADLDDALETLALERAQATVAARRARLDDAERERDDARRLVRQETLSSNELDRREAAVAIARAELGEAEAEARRIAERVERHAIRAPFAGIVAERLAEAGEWVEPGTGVVELVAVDALVIDVPVPQRQFPRIDAETEADVVFDALPGERFEARLRAKVPVSDPSVRTFTLRLETVAEDLPLTPGMSADVDLRLATGEQGVVVPRDALLRYPDGRVTVWTVVEGEGPDAATTVEERRIEPGAAAGGGALYVADGLEAGTEVVVRGNEGLRPGQRVRLAEPGG